MMSMRATSALRAKSASAAPKKLPEPLRKALPEQCHAQ